MYVKCAFWYVLLGLGDWMLSPSPMMYLPIYHLSESVCWMFFCCFTILTSICHHRKKNQGCRPGRNSESCYWQLFFDLGLTERRNDKRSQVSSRNVNNHYSASLTWWICGLLMRSHYQICCIKSSLYWSIFYQHLYWMVIQIYKYKARYTNNLSNNISLIVVVLHQPLFRSF